MSMFCVCKLQEEVFSADQSSFSTADFGKLNALEINKQLENIMVDLKIFDAVKTVQVLVKTGKYI